MRSLPISMILTGFLLLCFAFAIQGQDTPDMLRARVEHLASFEFVDLMSTNTQTVRFPSPCIMTIEMRVVWEDGGEWLTTWVIPLESVFPQRVRSEYDDTGLMLTIYLETDGDRISVHEQRDEREQKEQTYVAAIRMQGPDEAAKVVEAISILAQLCSTSDTVNDRPPGIE
jgi:hypothetical protein